MDPGALREVLSLVGKGGKAKGIGYKGKGWDSQKGAKGKVKAGKDTKGDGKEPAGKGTRTFNGNCHTCGVWGHRAFDCPEPRQQQGVGYVSDYYQGAPSTQVAFMVTDFEVTQVDSRHPWCTVGK